jgi:hypothetical protein
MPASIPVAGLGLTYNLPNFGGELFTVAPDDTRFLSAIGGLSQGGGVVIGSPEVEWQADVIVDPNLTPALEGADAPAGSNLARGNFSNLVEIYHDAFGVSYTAQAARGLMAGVNNDQANPVTNEIAHQTQVKLRQAGIHWNKRLLTGVYHKPADNTTARSTRGLLNAATTNVADLNSAALTRVAVLDFLQGVFATHGIISSLQPTILVSATLKRGLTKLFVTDMGYIEQTRNVGGVAVTSIITEFGEINVMLERNVPATTLAFAHLGLCKPVFLLVPGKGFLFVEPLAKTGSTDKYQLYGECGLEYGPEIAHGVMTEVGAVAGA